MACGTEGGRLANDRGLPVFSVHMKQGFIYLFQELNPISKTLSAEITPTRCWTSYFNRFCFRNMMHCSLSNLFYYFQHTKQSLL